MIAKGHVHVLSSAVRVKETLIEVAMRTFSIATLRGQNIKTKLKWNGTSSLIREDLYCVRQVTVTAANGSSRGPKV